MESLHDFVSRYGGLAWRRRWWGVAAAWLLSIVGWIAVASLPNQYEASARVYINADAVLTPLLRGIAADSSMNDQIDLLQHMLLSRPNLEKIIAKTDLSLDTHTATDMEQMVYRLGTTIKVSPQGRNIFAIAFRNPDRQLAFDVVQALLASYIENRAGDNRDDMEKASAFLDEQIASYEKQLTAAEKARAEFRRRYVDVLPGDGGVNRLEQAKAQVIALSGQLTDAKSHGALLAKQLATTSPTVRSAAVGSAGAEPRSELRAAEAKLRELEQVYTSAYPEVISQKRTVEKLRSIDSGAGGAATVGLSNPVYEQLTLKSVENQALVESLKRQLDDATVERNRLQTIAQNVPGLEAKYVDLNRDYDVLRKNYDELLARREGMRIATAAQVRASNVKMVIIDPPQVPQRPVAPARIILSIGVLLAGLASGVGVIMAMMTLDQSFHNIIDLRAMGRPVIGAISLAALPPTIAMRLRHAAVFGSALGLLVVLLGGVLLHYTQRI